MAPKPQWEGEFNEEGLPHGVGKMSYPKVRTGEEEEEEEEEDDEDELVVGDMYEGPMVNGVREGKGKYTFQRGGYYEGDYIDNKKHGKGIIKFPDGGTYEGEWAENKMHGRGFYIYANGDMYEGDFVNGEKHGKGSYFHKAVETQFIGDWENGHFVKGVWLHKDGSRFEGDFTESRPTSGLFTFQRPRLKQLGEFQGNGLWAPKEELKHSE
uniref:Radial spoke head 1 n=1 Tax=Tetraselmis sp. GSL018 TaxID=582737 RepID=A0A061S2J2_9CHLO|mmetsp:Transcript_12767/g.30262  ORF Transcript_12767/g.30262 Transcript_12767/m.30262 type:complete len:211 (-) Transcript_12767:210-842(-)|eukprot:CAMPEP_0177608826 /NCGR_PEP_ID=MMETSP0419_2-20121207/18696_1 /TAXON_ID=582737 /ORGANISM="Tetraselmis sp., Strain GSL018" /LENGTH=210 /DNA_ID=CAMNT_0019103577 /DNA_START=75 /DNA_END=707 /DNA_ORIENTATION=-